MDGKLVLGFIADILYAKKVINVAELEAIYDIEHAKDLNVVLDKMLGGEYIAKRGETYAFNA